MLQGAKAIKIHGPEHAVRAEVTHISGLSAHADYQELIEWLKPANPPARTFITHGEPSASAALRAHLEEALGWRSEIPGDGDAIRIGAPP